MARLYLRLTGHRILATRYKVPMGEIDIVASRAGTLIFIEVKTRARNEDYGTALEQVNRRRLSAAARAFVSRHPRWATQPMRFDVIFVAPFSWPMHVRGAFETSPH